MYFKVLEEIKRLKGKVPEERDGSWGQAQTKDEENPND